MPLSTYVFSQDRKLFDRYMKHVKAASTINAFLHGSLYLQHDSYTTADVFLSMVKKDYRK